MMWFDFEVSLYAGRDGVLYTMSRDTDGIAEIYALTPDEAAPAPGAETDSEAQS